MKARKKSRAKAATQAEVGEHLLLGATRVAELVGEGVFQTPLRLDQCREAYIRHQRETAAGRRRGFSSSSSGSGGSDRGENARAFFDLHLLPEEQLIPWQHNQVLTVSEYAERTGIGDGIIDLIALGLPWLPPAAGEKEGRVSWPHAERWRVLLAGALYQLTGVRLDGDHGGLERLAPEIRRARGLAV